MITSNLAYAYYSLISNFDRYSILNFEKYLYHEQNGNSFKVDVSIVYTGCIENCNITVKEIT